MYSVLIVDDSAIVRSLFETVINSSGEGRYRIVEQLKSAAAAVQYVRQHRTDLVLMDVYTENRENGIEAAGEIKKCSPGTKVIVVTSLPEMSFIDKSREAGCESFWYKEHGDMTILEVMDRTMAGESVYPDASPTLDIGCAKSVEFTRAEVDVLRLLCEGCSNKEIGEALSVSENTVKTHIKNMLSKAGYNKKYQLAIDAVEKKLIVPGF